MNDTVKRGRSPNYPAISLPDAINMARNLYAKIHKHPAPKEVVVKAMGYSGLNGASASAISAVQKYGLIEKAGEDYRLSERSMQIFAPRDQREKYEALKSAALEPNLFAQICEQFPGRLPNDELLRSYLIRQQFVPSAIGPVIRSFRQTMELVEEESSGYNPAEEVAANKDQEVQTETAQPVALGATPMLGPSTFYGGQETAVAARRAIFDLLEGEVMITYPEGLSAESVLDLNAYLEIFMKKLRRESGAELPKPQSN